MNAAYGRNQGGDSRRTPEIAATATERLENSPTKGRCYLTEKTFETCKEATEAYWNPGDLLGTKYDGQW
jgi:hypothetical protein